MCGNYSNLNAKCSMSIDSKADHWFRVQLWNEGTVFGLLEGIDWCPESHLQNHENGVQWMIHRHTFFLGVLFGHHIQVELAAQGGLRSWGLSCQVTAMWSAPPEQICTFPLPHNFDAERHWNPPLVTFGMHLDSHVYIDIFPTIDTSFVVFLTQS